MHFLARKAAVDSMGYAGRLLQRQIVQMHGLGLQKQPFRVYLQIEKEAGVSQNVYSECVCVRFDSKEMCVCFVCVFRKKNMTPNSFK